jgi:hypothetical protein
VVQIRKTFINKINEQANHFINSNRNNGPKWTNGLLVVKMRIILHTSQNLTLVFDNKFTPENIEAWRYNEMGY